MSVAESDTNLPPLLLSLTFNLVDHCHLAFSNTVQAQNIQFGSDFFQGRLAG